MSKLDNTQKHLLHLIEKDADADGWTKISHIVYPLVINASIPSELAIFEQFDDGSGRGKLTHDGKVVLKYI